MNKRNLLLLGVLGLLAAIYGLKVLNQQKTTLQAGDIAFGIADTAAVQKIVLQDYFEGDLRQEVSLKRQPDGSWQVNDRYPVLEPRIERLLHTLQSLHVKEPLLPQGQATALKLIEKRHTKVSIYDASGDALNAYYLSTATRDNRGSVMMLAKG